MIIRDATASLTPTSIARIGHAVKHTLQALSMLIISLSDAISKLFRSVVGVLGKPIGNAPGGSPQPPPVAPAPSPADCDDEGSTPDGMMDDEVTIVTTKAGVYH